LAQQPREQVPDQLRRDARPVPLVIEPQQHLGHRDACQLGVGHFRPAARPAPGEPASGVMRPVSST
jgi:hypothetical protein